MKKLLLIVTVATLPFLPVSGGEKTAKEKVVPKDKTYVQLDAKNKEIARFKAGESTVPLHNCKKVTCPSKYGSGVVCWVCPKEKPAQSSD